MDIQKIVSAYAGSCRTEDYEIIKAQIGHDSCKKVSAILDILEIGETNVAHAKLILRLCEDSLEKFSLVFGTKRG